MGAFLLGVGIAGGLTIDNPWGFVVYRRRGLARGCSPMEGSNRAVVRFWRAGDTNAPRGVRAGSNAL